MTLTQDTRSLSPWAKAVAKEVRKTLAARETPVTALDGIAGRNRMYWQRRINKPTIALDINDLAVLADHFGKPITSFFPANPETSDYRAEVLRPNFSHSSRPKGRTGNTAPRTREAA